MKHQQNAMTLLDMPNGIIPVSRFSSVIETQGKYQGYYQKTNFNFSETCRS